MNFMDSEFVRHSGGLNINEDKINNNNTLKMYNLTLQNPEVYYFLKRKNIAKISNTGCHWTLGCSAITLSKKEKKGPLF